MAPQIEESIPMQFVMIAAHQDPKAEHDEAHGGAYVSCWIKNQTAESALRIAKEWIQKSGWIIEKVEERHPISSHDYSDNPEALRYYEQALIDDEVFVFHVFPPE